MVRLDGKAVVVTGAGRGLGRAYALAAAGAGAAVVVNDIEEEPAAEVAAEIDEAGGRAVAVVADVSVSDQAFALVDRCVTEYGTVDGLVNNAGFGMIDAAAAQDQGEGMLRRVFEVNVYGTVFCGMRAIRHMLAQHSGSIVNVSSGAASGTGRLGAYSASKGAVTSLTLSWAAELEGTGVRANAVAPMAITRNWDWSLIPDRSAAPPAERLTPESNAGVVTYLLSDESAAVHGQIVAIRAGQLSLMTHPAAVTPVLSKEFWSAEDVVDAFAGELAGRALPLGMAQVSLAAE